MTRLPKPSFFLFRNVPFWATFTIAIVVAIGMWPG